MSKLNKPTTAAAPTAAEAQSTYRRKLNVARTSSGGTHYNTVNKTWEDGDILLSCSRVPGWIITKATGGRFSHAGICTEAAESMAAHASPPKACAIGIADFFCKAHAPKAAETFRYSGDMQEAPAKAAQWAKSKAALGWDYDLSDPIVEDTPEDSPAAKSKSTNVPESDVASNERVYCSEFVWKAYRDGAGEVLVLKKDFRNVNLFYRTAGAVLTGGWPKFGSRAGKFLAPSQLAESPKVKSVHKIR